MLFALKKIISFFIDPLGIVVVLAIVSGVFFYKKQFKKAKILATLSFGIVIFFSLPFVSNSLAYFLESQYPPYKNLQKDMKSVDFIVVLGSGHNDKNNYPLSSKIGFSSLKRVFESVTLYKNYAIKPTIVFTGYAGSNNISNAKINSIVAQKMGVDKKNIIINPAPKDTKEEIVFLKKLTKNKTSILVTSAMHMPRAIILSKQEKFYPTPAPTDFYSHNGFFASMLSLPNPKCFTISQKAIHEYIGILWAIINN